MKSAKPKTSLAIVPIVISDQNAFAVVGLTADQFRERVRAHSIPHRIDGRRVFVLARDFEKFVSQGSTAIDPKTSNNDEPDTVDAVLAALGKRRVSGAR